MISSHEYEHNLANQRTRADLADGSYWEYSYDDLGQVTGGVKKDSNDAAIPGYSFGYSFDDIGNRKTSNDNGAATVYEANLLNQYTEIDRSDVTFEPEFDADGNLTRDHLWEYTWNSENRLVKQEHRADVDISPLDRIKLEFAYDSQGRRVRKTVSIWDAQTEAYILEEDLRFVYDGWNLLAEIKSDDSMLRSHVWGPDLSLRGGLAGRHRRFKCF